VDNQLVDAFEILVTLGCVAGGVLQRSDRVGTLSLGTGLLAWALGDVIWTLEGSPNGPSLADGFYIAFYRLAFFAIVRPTPCVTCRQFQQSCTDSVALGFDRVPAALND
jgi:hypothetical protein